MTLGTGLCGAARWSKPARSQTPHRWHVGFANITEDPAERLEGLGFTGPEVRASFAYAARGLPIEMIYFDNGGNREKALTNAAAAVRQKLDLYIQYCADQTANDEIAKRLGAAAIPVIAINHPVPGAPLYTADNFRAGQIAGEALAEFALETWPGERVTAVIIGAVADKSGGASERADGVAAALEK